MSQSVLARLLTILGALVLAGLAFALPARADLPVILPTAPDCTPSGSVPVQMDRNGADPMAFHFKVNDGPTQQEGTSDDFGTIAVPSAEGRYKLEYWARNADGETPEDQHQVKNTLYVDRTNPSVSVASEQNKSTYVIKRQASLSVQAGDGLSGLASNGNPSGPNQTVGTESRGKKVVEKTARDLCGNSDTERFEYTVLGPVLGRLTVVEPIGRQVNIRLPGSTSGRARASQKGQAFNAIREPREIPVGSTIDTRRGAARITSSQGGNDTTIQDGAFLAGVFQVLQSRRTRSRGLTELRLKGSSFRRCRSRRRAGNRASASARRRLSRRTIRRLRGNANGRFRTRGRYSAATVRGTRWVTADRCDGTLTRVSRGRVVVRDFRRKRNVLLRAGKSYLARAR